MGAYFVWSIRLGLQRTERYAYTYSVMLYQRLVVSGYMLGDERSELVDTSTED